MDELVTTEIATNLSEILEAVEYRHEMFRITRGGRVIARIVPEEPAPGRAVKDLVARHPVDPAWRDDLDKLRASLTFEA